MAFSSSFSEKKRREGRRNHPSIGRGWLGPRFRSRGGIPFPLLNPLCNLAWVGLRPGFLWVPTCCRNPLELSTILSGQELLASREFWPHVTPVHCSYGPHVLFRWDPHGPTYYLGGAHIIFKFNSMLPSLPTLPFFIFMFFSFLILIIDIQKVICNTILIFSHTSQR